MGLLEDSTIELAGADSSTTLEFDFPAGLALE